MGEGELTVKDKSYQKQKIKQVLFLENYNIPPQNKKKNLFRQIIEKLCGIRDKGKSDQQEKAKRLPKQA